MAAALASVTLVVGGSTAFFVQQRPSCALESETVNDHLRMLGGTARPGGRRPPRSQAMVRRQARLRAAVRFAGNDDFPLQGGAVEPFLDRRAAVFVYKRRLHTASLFVVQCDGPRLPAESAHAAGSRVQRRALEDR
jgi:hypothetical protein